VLDEPNANLDQAGESALADAIARLKKENCLLIIVGHRPSTLAQADKILVIKDGCIGMFGPRDEIMRALTEMAPKAQSPQHARTAINEASEAAAQAQGVRS
jgi:ATP-binding cassette subfamily C protein/ATP-binding cassette subfamily C exporter for protease/lipase/ATP-binding cassette subfamily C protein EexD